MIGLFDSGYGGLTILRAIHGALPEYSTIYLGDNARAPYGERSDEEIFEYTKQGVDALFKKGCPLVILACNTASAAALRRLQQEWLPSAWPDRRVLGILVPTVEAMSSGEKTRVGILATAHTVATGAYEREIKKRNPNIEIIQYACTELAGLIELYGAKDPRVFANAQKCVMGLFASSAIRGSLDALLLGCTHYEFVADQIQSQLPLGVSLIRQPEIVAKSLQDYLKRHSEMDSKIEKEKKHTYLTTGDAHEVSEKSEGLMGEVTSFTHITL